MLTNQKCYLRGLDDKLTTLALLWKKIKFLVVLTMANRKYNDKVYLSKFTCEPTFLVLRGWWVGVWQRNSLQSFQPYPVTFLHRFDLENS